MKIGKLIVAITVLLQFGLSQKTNAQSFEKGKHLISTGYGYTLFQAGADTRLYKEELNASVEVVGPISLQYEFAVKPKFGIGLDIGYSNSILRWNEDSVQLSETREYIYANYKYTNTKITVNLRAVVHFGEHDIIDPYLAFGVGYKSSTWVAETNDTDFNNSVKHIPVSILFRFGTRFLITDNIGLFVESGFGHGFSQAGLTVKI